MPKTERETWDVDNFEKLLGELKSTVQVTEAAITLMRSNHIDDVTLDNTATLPVGLRYIKRFLNKAAVTVINDAVKHTGGRVDLGNLLNGIDEPEGKSGKGPSKPAKKKEDDDDDDTDEKPRVPRRKR